MFSFCAAALLQTALLAADGKVEEVVSISGPYGWRLSIRADGSAGLRCATDAAAVYSAPAGTFDAEQLRKSLLALPSATREESRRREHYVYWFEAERKLAPEKEPPSRFSQDEAVIVPLFAKAAEAGEVKATEHGRRLLSEKSFKLPPQATRRDLYSFHTPSGWLLSIRNDGSAQLVFGDGGGLFTRNAPDDTFRPDEVRKTLAAVNYDPKGSQATHFIVWTEAERKSAEQGPPPRYTRDERAITALFEQAAAASGEKASDRLLRQLGEQLPAFGLAK